MPLEGPAGWTLIECRDGGEIFEGEEILYALIPRFGAAAGAAASGRVPIEERGADTGGWASEYRTADAGTGSADLHSQLPILSRAERAGNCGGGAGSAANPVALDCGMGSLSA